MIDRWTTLQCDTRVDESRAATYVECDVGDFATRGKLTTDITFDEADAAVLGRLAISLAGVPSRLMIALYPWVQEQWERVSATRWSTVHSNVFRRRGLFGAGGTNLWVVGHAHDQDKLGEILHWAWTLPGRDTLLLLPAKADQVAPLIQAFEDDREDDGSNEIRLLQWYPVVISRGREGRCVRILSSSLTQEVIEGLVARARRA